MKLDYKDEIKPLDLSILISEDNFTIDDIDIEKENKLTFVKRDRQSTYSTSTKSSNSNDSSE